ncbi:hypothetical protein CDAR_283091 [Caerostris darwini]|uniref:Uncharacterized protein n=1 Tax=Caerostris darwini TaxID=1538125 RepID=A0AAV4QHJ3_9ARAC|nr:hypothetical protein CDAR_283091 [Caerostris darwini]
MPKNETDNRQINYDLANLTSVGLALFDIRNWYAGFLRAIEVGECIISQCINTWNLFLDSMQTSYEHVTGPSCPLCRERELASDDEEGSRHHSKPRTGSKRLENKTRGCISVPDKDKYNSKKKRVEKHGIKKGSKVMKSETSSTASASPKVYKKVTHNKHCPLVTKKSTNSKKNISFHSKRQKNEMEKSLPLVSQRPKRQRNED